MSQTVDQQEQVALIGDEYIGMDECVSRLAERITAADPGRARSAAASEVRLLAQHGHLEHRVTANGVEYRRRVVA